DWNDGREIIALPAEEFGKKVTYPDGFWLSGTMLFVGVALVSGLIAFTSRKAIITIEGYNKPKGSRQLQLWGYVVTGIGVSISAMNPVVGPLIFVPGIASLVVSIQQLPD
ncbi:MAG: hypothetical protein ACKOWI_02575, partial [Rhodoluna sp.]